MAKKTNFIEKITEYFKGAFSELKKVVWPTKKQTTTYSIIVISLSIGIAIFLGALDYMFNFLLNLII